MRSHNRLNTIGSHNKVWILWVRGQIILEGNEAADELARKEARMWLYGPEPFCGIRKGTMVMTLKIERKQLKKLYCVTLPQQFTMLMGGHEPMCSRNCLHPTKKTLRIILGKLTDHCSLDYFEIIWESYRYLRTLSVDSMGRVMKRSYTFQGKVENLCKVGQGEWKNTWYQIPRWK